jgi:hypothetical protein
MTSIPARTTPNQPPHVRPLQEPLQLSDRMEGTKGAESNSSLQAESGPH